MEEDLQIIEDLVADYLSGAGADSDYLTLARAISDRTNMSLTEVLRILIDNDDVMEKREELQRVSDPSGWTPRLSADTGSGFNARGPGAVASRRTRPEDVNYAYDYGDPIDDQRPAGFALDPERDFEVAGREQTAEERFASEDAARIGAISNFIRSNYGENIGATFRDFLTNRNQQDALQSRFQLAGTASPEGTSLGFADFMKGIGDQPGQTPFRTRGANMGQLDLLARYLATPDSGAFRITPDQESAIEDFRSNQQKQFNLLRNPIIANLSPYARGGYMRSSAARFADWLGRNIDNPNAQYLDYARSRGFMP